MMYYLDDKGEDIMFGEAIEKLFEVKQKKNTLPKTIMTFVLFLVLANMLFIFFAFEDRIYGAYKEDYAHVKSNIIEYKTQNGNYPVAKEVDWSKEKNLYNFLIDNKFTMGSTFYYLDLNVIEGLEKVKMKYIIDIDREIVYTSQSVPYKNKRWHIPMVD